MCLRGMNMDNKTAAEIQFHIINEIDREVDEKQLLNMVEQQGDNYILRAYGKTLKFNSEGDLI